MRVLICVLVVGVLGCGDDGGSSTIDAPAPDAPLIDAPPPPMGHQYYVIDKVRIPTNNNQARAYGLDINNDATIDNQLGMVLGTLATMGFPVQEQMDRSVDTGVSITLVDLFATDLTNIAGATIALFEGTNPMPDACNGTSDTTCRRHLAGTGTFMVSTTPVNPPLQGNIVGGMLDAGPGQLALDLAFPDSPVVSVTLLGARMKVSMISATAIGTAIIGGAISQTEINTRVVPAMRDGYVTAMARDCSALSSPPLCGCASGSTGKTVHDLFDTNPNDCMITVAEVQNNNLIQSLLAPDVVINGVMALSIGVSASAVPAGYVAP